MEIDLDKADLIARSIKKEIEEKNIDHDVCICAMALVIVESSLDAGQSVEDFTGFIQTVYDGFVYARKARDLRKVDKENQE